MIVFDLVLVTDTCSRVSCMTAILYDEDNPTISKKMSPVPGRSMLTSVANQLHKKYPKHFPSKDQLIEEITAVHNLNIILGENGFGQEYPQLQ